MRLMKKNCDYRHNNGRIKNEKEYRNERGKVWVGKRKKRKGEIREREESKEESWERKGSETERFRIKVKIEK